MAIESGNPWGRFVANARDVLGGDPSDIVVDGATLRLLESSKNIVRLGEAFNGDLSVQFEMNSSKTSTLSPMAPSAKRRSVVAQR